MLVKELVEKLLKCNQEMPVALLSNGNTYISTTSEASHGKIRIALLNTYAGDHVLIGNAHIRDLNGINYSIEKELDELGEIPNNRKDRVSKSQWNRQNK